MNTTEEWRLSPSLTDYIVSSEGRIMRVPYIAGRIIQTTNPRILNGVLRKKI